MTVCKGCGAVLQTTDSKAIGYSPKADAEYCQRCFRLIHYDDLTISMKTGIDPDAVIDRIAKMDALILWVIDLYDFEAGIINGINRKLADKDIVKPISAVFVIVIDAVNLAPPVITLFHKFRPQRGNFAASAQLVRVFRAGF